MASNLRLKLTVGSILRMLGILAIVSGVVYVGVATHLDEVTDHTLRVVMARKFDQRAMTLPKGMTDDRSMVPVFGPDDTNSGDDAIDFMLPLNSDALLVPDLLTNADLSATLTRPDLASVKAAGRDGFDWRTVYIDGIHVRLLTAALPHGASLAFLQIGKVLTDDDYIKRQILFALIGFMVVFTLLGGGMSWWEIGRTLRIAHEAWNRQQTFIANASHELRTPLTMIRASAQVAQRGLAADDPTRQILHDVVSEVDYMSTLLEEMLLLSRLDANQLQLSFAPIWLPDLLQQIRRQFAPLADERGVSLCVNQAEGTILADPIHLRQVLIIVIDNALRHTPAGGIIVIDSRMVASTVRISVADTGTGISADDLPHVFERFYKAKDTTRLCHDNLQSSGLGLAIAKSLVELHSGEISIDSKLSVGTWVIITLPAHLLVESSAQSVGPVVATT